MIVEKFKEICTQIGWFFNYGDYNWQNLIDRPDDTDSEMQGINLLLLWKDRERKFNNFNTVEAEVFTGEFLLVVRSLLYDKDYTTKYEKRISKLEGLAIQFFSKIGYCEGLTLESWKEVEVSDVLDNNLDGLKIKFVIRYDHQ